MKFFSKKIVLPSLAIATAVALLPSCNNGGGGKGSGGGSTPSDGPVNPPPAGGDTPTVRTNAVRNVGTTNPPIQEINPYKSAHHVREKNLASGLTSLYQYGYGVYMVVMTPSQMKGMVSSFYLYDNLADLKSYYRCSKQQQQKYSDYNTDKSKRVLNWLPDSEDLQAKTAKPPIPNKTDDPAVEGMPTSQNDFDGIKNAISDETTGERYAQCGWPSHWHEIDFEFVPGYQKPKDETQLRPVIDQTCIDKSNCKVITFDQTKSQNYISFNTFNMDEVIAFNVKYPALQGTQYQFSTDPKKIGTFYRSYSVAPDYQDKDNNSNLNVFYDPNLEQGKSLADNPQLYVIYYTPAGIFWSQNENPADYAFDSNKISKLPAPVFVKNDSTNSTALYPDSIKDASAKDIMFRYNAHAFNYSPTDETNFTKDLISKASELNKANSPNNPIPDILNHNQDLHIKYDGRYTSAKMNISINLWDGSSQEDGFWGGETAPSNDGNPNSYPKSEYYKIAYYPLKNLNISVKDITTVENYQSTPAFYSDFENSAYYLDNAQKSFKDLWAIDENQTFKWGSDDDISKNVYLFSNRYTYPLGQFHNGLISCKPQTLDPTKKMLILSSYFWQPSNDGKSAGVSTPAFVMKPDKNNPSDRTKDTYDETIQGCYSTTP